MDWDRFEDKFLREKGRDKGAEQRKIEKEVFDEFTADTVWKLARRGHLDFLGGVVSTGKEANVFKGWDREGNVRAYKIYRIETSNFQSMWDYIEGDKRFERVRPVKRHIVLAWCQKELKNLQTSHRAGCRVPEPFFSLNNILIMQFIGNEFGAPLLKDVELDEPSQVYRLVAEDMKKLHKAGIVHADLSEFNVLWWQEKPWMIDIGQGVPLSHPKADQFLRRDCENVEKYFKKLGVKAEGLYEEITG
ncbi:MAG: serine protein kinase RIO [Candidatus Diapherotrites archaeon]|nr:serine protein kinase RIO [Candidatus Diapherotrites archaeon]